MPQNGRIWFEWRLFEAVLRNAKHLLTESLLNDSTQISAGELRHGFHRDLEVLLLRASVRDFWPQSSH